MRFGLHFLAGGLMVYAAMAACSASRAAHSDAGGAGSADLTAAGAEPDPTSEPVPSAAAAEPVSPRLRSRFILGDDGSKQPLLSMWDSKLGVACTYQKAPDGKLRCLPAGGPPDGYDPSDYVAGSEGHE